MPVTSVKAIAEKTELSIEHQFN